MIACSFNCTTGGVPQDHYQFGAGQFGGELHGSQDVFVHEVSGDADTEYISDPLVEQKFGRYARIYTV